MLCLYLFYVVLTRIFVLNFTEISQDLITEQAGTNPLIIVVISVITLVIAIILVLALVKWRQRWSKPNYRFARNSVHRRHQSGL